MWVWVWVSATAFFVNFFLHSPKRYLYRQIEWLSVPQTIDPNDKICY